MNEPGYEHDEPKGASREERQTMLFLSTVAQHANMALMFLGRIPHPETGERVRDLVSVHGSGATHVLIAEESGLTWRGQNGTFIAAPLFPVTETKYVITQAFVDLGNRERVSGSCTSAANGTVPCVVYASSATSTISSGCPTVSVSTARGTTRPMTAAVPSTSRTTRGRSAIRWRMLWVTSHGISSHTRVLTAPLPVGSP